MKSDHDKLHRQTNGAVNMIQLVLQKDQSSQFRSYIDWRKDNSWAVIPEIWKGRVKGFRVKRLLDVENRAQWEMLRTKVADSANEIRVLS